MASKCLKLILVLAVAVLVFACKTAPEVPEEGAPEQPAEQPVQPPEEKPPEPAAAPEEAAPAAVTEDEIREARAAIARAKEADADYYEPGLLREAEAALNTALALKESDPERAREELAISREKADLAFDLSVQKAAAALRERMERMVKQLRAIDAHRFLPDEYEEATAGVAAAEALFARGDVAAAREEAYAALAAMSELNDRLSERQLWVSILKRDINQYLQDAEELQAHLRTPEEFQEVNRLYLEGVEAYQSYKLYDSEELLGSARERALALLELARGRAEQEKQQARALMLEVMQDLQDASELTVVTEDGTLIEPEPWSGDEFLEEPEDEEAGGQSFLLLVPGTTAVLGEISEENLLAQAKQLWQQGVKEWRQGNYQVAQEYFAESKKLVEAYKTQAVNPNYPIYVVRLIPDRRDCLWRIAEYDFIYNDPYLWPKIWRRNRKLIQHPDLIYPGWKLVIPPE
jgi:nucleoid-associated protein YgaU